MEAGRTATVALGASATADREASERRTSARDRSRGQLVAELSRAAASAPSPEDVLRMRRITGELIVHHGRRAFDEFVRFNQVAFRQLRVCEAALSDHLRGQDIVVTGGTGCIGTALLMELSKYEPRRLVSIARGVTEPSGWVAGVEYRDADLRDRAAVDRVLAEVRPSTVYHVAAQRDPGVAETAVHRTLTTNVIGTQNLVEAAQRNEVGRLVYGSTGKAMRPYTRDTYAATKKAGEWLLGAASRGGMSCAAARFTHVVDNSIIRRRLGDWIADGSPIRLHAPDIVFYVQSARESAQLLLTAGLEAEPGRFSIHVIKDLGYPIDLLDLAVGANLAMGRLSPVYLCGFEPGYEERTYPGVFDPDVSPDFSPLLNAFESAMAGPSKTTTGVDRFALRVKDSPRLRLRLRALDRACRISEDPADMRAALDDLSWDMLDASLACSPTAVRLRTVARMDRMADGATPEHDRITNAVRTSLGPSPA